jgi:hypothetical protein
VPNHAATRARITARTKDTKLAAFEPVFFGLGFLALADFAGDFFAGGLDREVPVFPGLFEPRVEVRDAMDPRLSADRVCPSHVESARGVRVASTTVSVRSTRGAEHTDSSGTLDTTRQQEARSVQSLATSRRRTS